MTQSRALLFAVATFVGFAAIVLAIAAALTDGVGIGTIAPLLIVAAASVYVYRSAQGSGSRGR
jgi:fatty acid desaturase